MTDQDTTATYEAVSETNPKCDHFFDGLIRNGTNEPIAYTSHRFVFCPLCGGKL